MAFSCNPVTGKQEVLQSLKAVAIAPYPSSRVERDETDSNSPLRETTERSFKLGLYEVDTSRPGWEAWLSQLFGAHKDSTEAKFHVTLTQTTTSSSGETKEDCFELYHGTDQSESTAAFQSIENCLAPLMECGEITLTAELLSSLVSPTPKLLTELPALLLQQGRLQGDEGMRCLHARFAGKSLLHLACEANDESSFIALLDLGADFTATVKSDSSAVLHWASKHSHACLKHLLGHAKKFLSKALFLEFLHKRDIKSHSPLHTTMHHSNAEAAEALIAAGAQLAVPATSSSGENPLHVAAENNCHECITAAFKRHGFLQPIREDEKERKADQDAALRSSNADGDTPLLVAVREKHLKSSLTLILEGADPNLPNTTTLDTPLHIAALTGELTIVQLLLVFGAKSVARNGQGKTPIELAQEAHGHNAGREESIRAIQEVITAQTEERPALPTLDPIPDHSAVLLSLDGGGVRGLVLAQLLLFLQHRVSKLCPECAHLSSFFDWVSGTSTGAFLALAFTHYKASPTACRKLYFHFKEKAFVGHRVYSTNHLESSIKDVFGEEEKLGDIRGPRLILTTCIADRLSPLLHLMCNYGGPRNGQVPPSDLPIWEAARATSAAPTYFEAFQNKFLDGGLMANNPTLDSMTEVYSHARKEGLQTVKIGCVISLGTGVPPTTHLKEGVNIIKPHCLSLISNLFHDAEALKDLVDLFIAQSTTSYGQEVDRSRAWCESIGAPFFRFSPPIDNIMLDETDDKKLIKMLFRTMMYTLEHTAEYEQLAHLLLSRGHHH